MKLTALILLRWQRWLVKPAIAGYIGLIALIAARTGITYVLFPELGALAHDILRRPHGAWAKAPVMLVLTPFLTAVAGTLIARHFSYGLVSVGLSVGCSIFVIRFLYSPIAPAISAGLLPLTLGVSSWRYPPSLLIGLTLLAGLAIVWQRFAAAPEISPSISTSLADAADIADDVTEAPPASYSWIPFFMGFLVIALVLAQLTGWRFLLFPPLVVMAFEMFAHAEVCPWAGRPVMLPVACTLTATCGVILVNFLGAGPLAAMGSTLSGAIVLRMLRLHAPPVIAVGLLPLVMTMPNRDFPVAVGAGSLLLTGSFLLWRKLMAMHLIAG